MARCSEGSAIGLLRSDRQSDPRNIPALQPRNGIKHQVRWLCRCDIQAIVRHMLSMDSDDRWSRFHRRMADTAIVDYYQKLRWNSVVLVGLFSEGTLRGIGEAILFKGDKGMLEAEVAISVSAAWRHQGYGRHLAARVSAEAILRGATRLHFHYLPHRIAAARIARSLGGDIDPATHTVTISQNKVIPHESPPGSRYVRPEWV
jgi:GNAT superfamily N-acetyltransferase